MAARQASSLATAFDARENVVRECGRTRSDANADRSHDVRLINLDGHLSARGVAHLRTLPLINHIKMRN